MCSLKDPPRLLSVGVSICSQIPLRPIFSHPLGLRERLSHGETVIIAEGYLFELERRGYLQAGAFIPEVVLRFPDVVKSVHREFALCGSDVVLAFTVKQGQ